MRPQEIVTFLSILSLCLSRWKTAISASHGNRLKVIVLQWNVKISYFPWSLSLSLQLTHCLFSVSISQGQWLLHHRYIAAYVAYISLLCTHGLWMLYPTMHCRLIDIQAHWYLYTACHFSLTFQKYKCWTDAEIMREMCFYYYKLKLLF